MTYDANGSTLSDGMNSYVWDARNRLVSADNNAASFAYDPLGRRVSKTILSTTTNFLYDGANAVQEFGTLPTANLLTGGVDERFTRTTSTETDDYLIDALGSTVTLTDAAGNSVAQYSYAPFGSLSASGATTSNSYTYTGRESDGLGIDYYRARYYNPTTGRFLSEDPLGFAGSWTNFYRYAADNPINFNDPFGLNVTITYYPNAAAGYGHVGVGVNSDQTSGFYPINNSWCLVFGCSTPGNLLWDQMQSGYTPYSVTIPTTPEQDAAMQAAINQRQQNGGMYNLRGRNCARFAEDVLNAGGVPNVPNTQYPMALFRAMGGVVPQ